MDNIDKEVLALLKEGNKDEEIIETLGVDQDKVNQMKGVLADTEDNIAPAKEEEKAEVKTEDSTDGTAQVATPESGMPSMPSQPSQAEPEAEAKVEAENVGADVSEEKVAGEEEAKQE